MRLQSIPPTARLGVVAIPQTRLLAVSTLDQGHGQNERRLYRPKMPNKDSLCPGGNRLRRSRWYCCSAWMSRADAQPAQVQKAQGYFLAVQKAEKEKRYAQAAVTMAEEAQAASRRNDLFLAYAGEGRSAGGSPRRQPRTRVAGRQDQSREPCRMHAAQVMRSAGEAGEIDIAKDYAKKVVALGFRKVGKASVEEAKNILAGGLDGELAEKLYADAALLQTGAEIR